MTLKEAPEAKKARKKKKGPGKGEARAEEEESGVRTGRREPSGGAPNQSDADGLLGRRERLGGRGVAREEEKADDAPSPRRRVGGGETVKARLIRQGPRFTLELMSIQKGTADSEAASTSTCATGRWTGPDTTGENSFCDETRRRGRDGEGVTRALPRVPSRERSLVVRRRRRRRGELVGRRKLFPKKTAARVEDPLHTRYSSSLAFARRDPFRRSPPITRDSAQRYPIARDLTGLEEAHRDCPRAK